MNQTFAGFYQRKFCRMVQNPHNHQISETDMEIVAYASLCEQTNQLIIQKKKQRKLLTKKDTLVEDTLVKDTQAFADFDRAVNNGHKCVMDHTVDAGAYYQPILSRLKANTLYINGVPVPAPNPANASSSVDFVK